MGWLANVVGIAVVFHRATAAIDFTKIPSKVYKYESYQGIVNRLFALEEKHQGIIRVYTASEKLGVPAYGDSCVHTDPWTKEQKSACEIYIAEVETGYKEHYGAKPELFFSGELHGNERLGPHTAIETLELLLHLYSENDQYTRGLLDSRRLTVIPMTNAIGFYENKREELLTGEHFGRDPNRDFAFNLHPGESCAKTAAGQAVSKLFRDPNHAFSMMLTYHGGDNVIGYEWGDYSNCQDQGNSATCTRAPDHIAMHSIAEKLRDAAGAAGHFESPYIIGTMGETVYPVSGGMEDWAYGASWNKEGQNIDCAGSNDFNEQTSIDPVSFRCVSYLVEASMKKEPPEHELGTSDQLFVRGGKGDGHIPRNIRLTLAALELINPWVDMIRVSLETNDYFRVEWKVRGAVTIDETWLEYADADVCAEHERLVQWQSDVHEICRTDPHKDGKGTITMVGEEGGSVFSSIIPIDKSRCRDCNKDIFALKDECVLSLPSPFRCNEQNHPRDPGCGYSGQCMGHAAAWGRNTTTEPSCAGPGQLNLAGRKGRQCSEVEYLPATKWPAGDVMTENGRISATAVPAKPTMTMSHMEHPQPIHMHDMPAGQPDTEQGMDMEGDMSDMEDMHMQPASKSDITWSYILIIVLGVVPVTLVILFFVAKRLPSVEGLKGKIGNLLSRRGAKQTRIVDGDDSETVQMMNEINLDSDSEDEYR